MIDLIATVLLIASMIGIFNKISPVQRQSPMRIYK